MVDTSRSTTTERLPQPLATSVPPPPNVEGDAGAAGGLHARSAFQRDIERIQDEVLILGSMVAKATLRSVEALRARDVGEARAIDAEDVLVNRKRYQIEEEVIRLIATQQPMAGDLRRLTAMLLIATDLERIGDYAAGIARICVAIADEPLIKPLIDVPRMAERATSMLRRSLDAFVARDVEASETIAREDGEVDALYQQVYRELLMLMLVNPRVIDQATHLLWVAHNLERVADRVQNICERTIFVATGRMQEFSRGPLG
ncbi:MAG: phosphate signaling complex protein PhoU [Chloroflexi bacterium]|nr:phosphate signaling complex protein PhoU [Chloroflexota bacterium]